MPKLNTNLISIVAAYTISLQILSKTYTYTLTNILKILDIVL